MPRERHTIAIVGVGSASSQITVRLCREISAMYAHPEVQAVGVYDPTPRGDEARAMLTRLGLRNISITSRQHQLEKGERTSSGDVDVAHLTEMMNALIKIDRPPAEPIENLLWIMDAGKVLTCEETLMSLKRVLFKTVITVVCVLPTGTQDQRVLECLKRLSLVHEVSEQRVITTTILVDSQSPLVKSVGAPYQEQLIARSLAALVLAPLHFDGNPAFTKIIEHFADVGFSFAALAVDATGLVADEKLRWWQAVARWFSRSKVKGNVSYNSIYTRTLETAQRLLHGAGTSTAHIPLDPKQAALYISCLIPLRNTDRRFALLASDISRWLSKHYDIDTPSLVSGIGVDLSGVKPNAKGDYYCQVSVLYGIPDLSRVPRYSSPMRAEHASGPFTPTMRPTDEYANPTWSNAPVPAYTPDPLNSFPTDASSQGPWPTTNGNWPTRP